MPATTPMSADLKAALHLFQLPWPTTLAAVKHQYRLLAKQTHPDQSNGNRSAFAHVQAAHATLLQALQTEVPPSGEKPVNKQPEEVSSPAKAAANATSAHQSVTVKGITQLTVDLTPQQAVKGGRHQVVLHWQASCQRCYNQPARRLACKPCHGSGQQACQQTLHVMLPKGLVQGSQLRLVGQGIPQSNRQPADLLITFNILLATPKAQADAASGSNPTAIESEITVSVWQALLNQPVWVNTPTGQQCISLPPGLQPGQVVPVPQPQGLPPWAVTVKVALPTTPLPSRLVAMLQQQL
jgi:DnaJ-class molecular chaperone